MACHLTAPSHYLNQYWLIVNFCGIHITANFPGNTYDINLNDEFVNYIFKITATYPRRQWIKISVKVQFRGPKLYKKKRGLFQEESYLTRIFMSSSLNLHTFHLIHILFWLQIFFRKDGKSTPNDREDHHVLVVDVVIMTSQCRCTRALSQSHVAKHGNHVPAAPLIGSGLAVMSMQWLPYGKIISAKTLKLHWNWGHPSTIVSPTCSWRHEDTR